MYNEMEVQLYALRCVVAGGRSGVMYPWLERVERVGLGWWAGMPGIGRAAPGITGEESGINSNRDGGRLQFPAPSSQFPVLSCKGA